MEKSRRKERKWENIESDSLKILLERLKERSFYGSIELKFEAGKIVYLRIIETLKAEDLVCQHQEKY